MDELEQIKKGKGKKVARKGRIKNKKKNKSDESQNSDSIPQNSRKNKKFEDELLELSATMNSLPANNTERIIRKHMRKNDINPNTIAHVFDIFIKMIITKCYKNHYIIGFLYCVSKDLRKIITMRFPLIKNFILRSKYDHFLFDEKLPVMHLSNYFAQKKPISPNIHKMSDKLLQALSLAQKKKCKFMQLVYISSKIKQLIPVFEWLNANTYYKINETLLNSLNEYDKLDNIFSWDSLRMIGIQIIMPKIYHCGLELMPQSKNLIKNSILDSLYDHYTQFKHAITHITELYGVDLPSEIVRVIMDLYKLLFAQTFCQTNYMIQDKTKRQTNMLLNKKMNAPLNIDLPHLTNQYTCVHYNTTNNEMLNYCLNTVGYEFDALITKYFLTGNGILAEISINDAKYEIKNAKYNMILRDDVTIKNHLLKLQVSNGHYGDGIKLFEPLKIKLTGDYQTSYY